MIPAHVIAGASPAERAGFVHKVQEARLQVTEVFTSRFQDLVTAGRAADYPPLVDRFKLKFDACQQSLERISEALSAQPIVAGLVRNVAREESKRLELQLELQVLEQNLSMLGLDDPDQPDLKEKVLAKRKALKECVEGIYEVLEELRGEAADMEDD